MKKTALTVLIFCILFSGLLAGCGEVKDVHKHKWIPQTCTEPVTCTECGATKGEPWGHSFTEATCAHPATCVRCFITEGETLPHTFKEATFQTLKTCEVCGATEGDYLSPEIIVIDTKKNFYGISDDVVAFETEKGYGIMDTEGEILIKDQYNFLMTGLENNAFCLGNVSEQGAEYEIYDSEAVLLTKLPKTYKDFSLMGMAGGYLTLRNDENVYVYLDINDDFKQAAYIDANMFGKESLSLAFDGYVSTLNVGSLGYPYIDLRGPEYVSGQYGDDGYLDARGCNLNLGGELLVTLYRKNDYGAYDYESAGFYNVYSETYRPVENWFDDKLRLEHIGYYDAGGISTWDIYGNYCLIQSGVKSDEIPVYDLYDVSQNQFLTNVGFKELFLDRNQNVAVVYDESGNEKFSYVDSQCNLIGSLWDKATFFEGGLSMVLKDNLAYFMNEDLAVISKGIPATDIYHRFEKYFVVENGGESSLITVR